MSRSPSPSRSANTRSSIPELLVPTVTEEPQLVPNGVAGVNGLRQMRTVPLSPATATSTAPSLSRSPVATQLPLKAKALVRVLLVVQGLLNGLEGFRHSFTSLSPLPWVTLTRSIQPSKSKSAASTPLMVSPAVPTVSAVDQPSKGVPSFSTISKADPSP